MSGATHYRGRGFTHDVWGAEDLREVIVGVGGAELELSAWSSHDAMHSHSSSN